MEGSCYNTAANILAAQFNLQMSADNIRNRVKSWKKFYGVVSDILSQSGFSWDSTKKMISVDEDHVWEEYVKSHDDARGADATKVMTPTNEVDHVNLDGDTQDLEYIHVIDNISPTSTNGQKRRNRASNSSDILPTKKRGAVKDVITDLIARMALLFEEFIRADTKNLDPAEVPLPPLLKGERCEISSCLELRGMEKGLKMSCPLKQMETTPSHGLKLYRLFCLKTTARKTTA
ncbi:hypothetical protein L3X38_024175 [Prunus dulcis]|uniref:Myb/SANT-like domain-containing protein n=1 Tax=Prunus dulcis TaxID=3755 RepID=A0AAD4Z571_PRUDU|nr:hypothetical protein L3X38_024175 [Prunus dulcis]